MPALIVLSNTDCIVIACISLANSYLTFVYVYIHTYGVAKKLEREHCVPIAIP